MLVFFLFNIFPITNISEYITRIGGGKKQKRKKIHMFPEQGMTQQLETQRRCRANLAKAWPGEERDCAEMQGMRCLPSFKISQPYRSLVLSSRHHALGILRFLPS